MYRSAISCTHLLAAAYGECHLALWSFGTDRPLNIRNAQLVSHIAPYMHMAVRSWRAFLTLDSIDC